MDFLNNISANSTVLTPNRRLSAAILKKYNELNLTNGKKVWPTLDVLPFSSWVNRLWQLTSFSHFSEIPLILNTNQETILWEQILRQSQQAEHLLQVSGTAELIKSAWGILKQWQIPITHPELNTTEDAIAFQQWALEFQAICQKNNWLDSNSLIEHIIKKISQNTVQLPKTIYLFGFTELTPEQKLLFDLCEKHGSCITRLSATNQHPEIAKISLLDEEDEITAMARWAKALLDASAKKPISIGCIFPQLEKNRDTVVRIFSEVFSHQNNFTLNTLAFPFNISAGKPLSSYPIIFCALKLLTFTDENLALDDISYVLRTPFIGDAEKERLQRASLDNALRRKNKTHFSLSELAQHATCANKLKNRIEQFLNFKTTLTEKKTASQWTAIFNEQLNLWGWPGERSINSQEYQVTHRWLELLTEFASLETILPALTYKTALHYLNRLASKTIFQPQSPDAPIQILGLLEGAELTFDYLWIMGMDDHTWPPTPKPNPFIPLPLQKKYQMPHASAERELNYCMQLMTQLKRSAKKIIFSFPKQKAESELRPSSLLQSFPEITDNGLSLANYSNPAATIFTSKKIEPLVDEVAPTLTETETIKGGSYIYKLQAACPFRAFSELRLHARQLESADIGLRAQDRGMMLHKALEIIWDKLKDHATLCAYSEPALNELINHGVELALKSVVRETERAPRYLALESKRLHQLIFNWLQYEKKRDPFTVIAKEQELTTKIYNTDITLRIDRIDELEDGRKVIIDYKSGKYNYIKNWFSDRPEEPQLPLYCVLTSDHTHAILFAQIAPGNIEYKGISATQLNLKSVKEITNVEYTSAESWLDQINQWKMTLEKLSNDFYHGHSAVDPKNPVETCRHCHLQSFCRIYETRDVTYDEPEYNT